MKGFYHAFWVSVLERTRKIDNFIFSLKKVVAVIGVENRVWSRNIIKFLALFLVFQ